MAVEPELFRALGALSEAPDPAHARLAAALGLPGPPEAADHTGLFVLQLVPYASAYLSPDGMLGGEPADRVAGFWRALHLTPPAEPDHLAALLGLYAALTERGRVQADPARAALWRRAGQALLWEHLLTWLPVYTSAAARVAGPVHAAWARLLGDALLAEARAVPQPPTTALHLRERPAAPDPRDGPEPFARALLTPARSGLLLTRADLTQGARAAGLTPRLGERAFVLRSMLGQDPAATLGWLTDRAGEWAERHRATEPVLGDVARAWRTRAEATRAALSRARPTAMEVTRVS
ncbi:molecular chaperone TorD family protein [Streptomyces sediminimaris]|uniref:molecular chaperone TorD family protein n=1 Tax=Streptomyces sediminimaris TaxID=3383721 RepID=UPI00399B5389